MKKSFNICLMLNSFSSPFEDLFYFETTRGITNRSIKLGYNITITKPVKKQTELPDIIYSGDADGIILMQDTDENLIEKANKNRVPSVNSIGDITYKQALLLGGFQALAIIPGTSRSGSTILGSMLVGFSRPCGAEFSFFMGIPAMVGGSLIKALGFLQFVGGENSAGVPLDVPTDAWVILIVASLIAFAVSMVAIKFLMSFVKKHSFTPFGVYRIVLGVVVLLVFAIFGRLA
jgi:undecaprenyl pyrophosphate phosphatase UppP